MNKATNIWIFILFQLDEPIYNNKPLFLKVFILPLILQFLSIILAIIAYVSSKKQVARKGSNICIVYSTVSFFAFLIVSGIIMSIKQKRLLLKRNRNQMISIPFQLTSFSLSVPLTTFLSLCHSVL